MRTRRHAVRVVSRQPFALRSGVGGTPRRSEGPMDTPDQPGSESHVPYVPPGVPDERPPVDPPPADSGHNDPPKTPRRAAGDGNVPPDPVDDPGFDPVI